MVYENDSSTSQSRTILLNMQTREFANSGAVHADMLENAIRACAALVQETLEEGTPLRFLANTPEPVSTEEFWGEEHLHGLLELLALLPLKSGEHFPFYLNALYDDIRSTDIALVTCYLDEPILQFARDKQDTGVHVRLYVLDPGADAAQEDLDIYLPRWKARGREGGDEQS